MRVLRCAPLLALILTLVFCRPAAADDANLGRSAEGVYPLAAAAVALTDELVTVSVRHVEGEAWAADVRCSFTFVNRGPATTVLMGFPVRLAEPEVDPNPWHGLEVDDFEAWLDGNPLAVTTETAIPGPSPFNYGWFVVSEWATFRVPFGAGQRREVVHEYSIHLTGYSNGETLASYILQTGALWAEPIGQARVEFRMGEVQPWHMTGLHPAPDFRYVKADNTWVFEATNLRPEYDPTVRFSVRWWDEELLAGLDAERREQLQAGNMQWKAQFAAADAHRGDAKWLTAAHELAVRAALGAGPDSANVYAALARYIASLLPAGAGVGRSAPEITAIAAAPGTGTDAAGAGPWVLTAEIADRDFDLLEVQARCYESAGAGAELRLVAQDDWRNAGTSPTITYKVHLFFNPSPGKEHVFTVTARDLAGMSASDRLTFRTGGALTPDVPVPTVPKPVERPRQALRASLCCLAGLMLVAAAYRLVARRRGRGPGKGQGA